MINKAFLVAFATAVIICLVIVAYLATVHPEWIEQIAHFEGARILGLALVFVSVTFIQRKIFSDTSSFINSSVRLVSLLLRKEARLVFNDPAEPPIELSTPPRPEYQTITGQLSGADYEKLEASALLVRYTQESQSLAKSIYDRAGLYLFIGIISAVSGLGFFFFVNRFSSPMPDPNASIGILVLSEIGGHAPAFGMLFFIEFIAFYFLRQFRSAMDEFRYYEAIARNRQENVLLLKMIEADASKPSVLDLIKGSQFYSGAGKLGHGETTDLIETRKLETSDIEFIGKLAEVVSTYKKKS